MSDQIKHWEAMWTDAETLAAQTHANKTVEYILEEMIPVINDLKGFTNTLNVVATEILHSEEIRKSMTKKLIGELLYLVSAVSIRENVDVYSALKEHMESLFK